MLLVYAVLSFYIKQAVMPPTAPLEFTFPTTHSSTDPLAPTATTVTEQNRTEHQLKSSIPPVQGQWYQAGLPARFHLYVQQCVPHFHTQSIILYIYISLLMFNMERDI